jgi:hypothetical protein
MRQRGVTTGWCVLAACVLALSACAAQTPHKGRRMEAPSEASPALTAMPTVPPATVAPPTPSPEPIATRPVGTGKRAAKGETIGPVITYFGAARADGYKVEPQSVDKSGIPTYVTAAGSGFMLVVEAKPGASGLEVARRVFAYVPNDPTVRPDLEIQANRDLGNGSPEVCDRRRPNIGGIPAINPPKWAETTQVSNAINDFSCRFETFIESDSSCTLGPNGDYAFLSRDTTTQFCMIVARAYGFPVGDTLVSVRLRDMDGNPGPVKQIRIRRPPEAKAPAAK